MPDTGSLQWDLWVGLSVLTLKLNYLQKKSPENFRGFFLLEFMLISILQLQQDLHPTQIHH